MFAFPEQVITFMASEPETLTCATGDCCLVDKWVADVNFLVWPDGDMAGGRLSPGPLHEEIEPLLG